MVEVYSTETHKYVAFLPYTPNQELSKEILIIVGSFAAGDVQSNNNEVGLANGTYKGESNNTLRVFQ